MKRMTRAKLSKYIKKGRELRLIEMQLSQCHSVSDMVRGSSKYPPFLPRAVTITGVDAKQVLRLRYKKYRLTRELKEIAAFVDGVPDDYIRGILWARYIVGATWEQVADLAGESATSESLKKSATRYLERL